nr:hypothetical protein BCV31_10855 [Vibrio cyclitrophicus]
MNKISSNRVSYLDFWYLETGCKIEKLLKVSTIVLFLVNFLMKRSEFVTRAMSLLFMAINLLRSATNSMVSDEKGALFTRNNAPLECL